MIKRQRHIWDMPSKSTAQLMSKDLRNRGWSARVGFSKQWGTYFVSESGRKRVIK
jgi:hypothetical protein